jgi:GYF domain 2
MSYQVSRNGQMYGPYTLEDLRRYVASGNVLPTDMVKSEEMADWVPVSQVLGAPPEAAPIYSASTPFPGTPVYAAAPVYPPASGEVYPDPPNLHWALVLLFTILTCGVFSMVWDLVQALWVKRVQPYTKVLMYFGIFFVIWLLSLGGSIGRAALMMHGVLPRRHGLSALISIALLVMMIVYRFAMRQSLEDHFNGPEPIGLRLSGVMTFFFGGIYFQYHLSRINDMKRALRYGAGVR